MNSENRDAIHAVLTRLENEGQLSPDSVIHEARNAESPLHGEFTWDVEAAAMVTWRAQARQIISQFHVTYKVHRREYQIQEFVEALGKNGRDQGYVAFTRIKGQKELAQEFLDRELGIASTYVSKTADYARVLGLEKRVEGVVDEISALRTEARIKSAKRASSQPAAAH